jgi:hypothetical protein
VESDPADGAMSVLMTGAIVSPVHPSPLHSWT